MGEGRETGNVAVRGNKQEEGGGLRSSSDGTGTSWMVETRVVSRRRREAEEGVEDEVEEDEEAEDNDDDGEDEEEGVEEEDRSVLWVSLFLSVR
jgi:hypothetical protein